MDESDLSVIDLASTSITFVPDHHHDQADLSFLGRFNGQLAMDMQIWQIFEALLWCTLSTCQSTRPAHLYRMICLAIETQLNEAIYITRHAVVDQCNRKVIARSALVKVKLLYQDSDESFEPK